MDEYTKTEEAYKRGYAMGMRDAVVRCAECKHYMGAEYPGTLNCKHDVWLGHKCRDNDFCSSGKR